MFGRGHHLSFPCAWSFDAVYRRAAMCHPASLDDLVGYLDTLWLLWKQTRPVLPRINDTTYWQNDKVGKLPSPWQRYTFIWLKQKYLYCTNLTLVLSAKYTDGASRWSPSVFSCCVWCLSLNIYVWCISLLVDGWGVFIFLYIVG